MSRHLIIPDTQTKRGVPLEHIGWIAQAIVEYRPDVIVHLGDHWDMPSLNGHVAPGGLEMEGRRVADDIAVGNEALAALTAPALAKRARLRRLRRRRWNPQMHFLLGNHEDRITRAVAANPKLEGVLSLDMLKIEEAGFVRHPFLEIVELDGIWYSHYFQSAQSHRAIGGSIDSRLNKIGNSFVQGHQQGLLYGVRQYPGSTARHGLVAGSCYLHEESYRGMQGNGEWRGIVVLNEVREGNYDVMPLSMSYLRRKYGAGA